MKNQTNNFNKLINFHWVFIKKNPLLWILTSLCIFPQIILITVLEILNKPIIEYSLLLYLIPNILFTILIIYLAFILFLNNKDNSIDIKLLCSKYDKYKIKLARFSLIWIFLSFIIFISNLFLFYFVITNQLMLGLSVFLSNILITPILLLLITIIFTFLAIKLSKGLYVCLTILICIVTFGLSILTRLFINAPTLDDKNYYKLIDNNNQYLVQKNESDVDLNSQIKINSFVPSEWFYAPYSFTLRLVNDNINSKFNLQTQCLTQTNYDNLSKLKLFVIKPNDNNFLELSNNQYIDLICNDINEIINVHKLKQNEFVIKETTDFINQQVDWSIINKTYIKELLLDITGINEKYSDFFYLIKYHDYLNFDINILFKNILLRFNKDVENLFKSLVISNNTFYNLFKSNNEFNSLKIYPNEYVANDSKPIVLDDINFLKNSLIQFTTNKPVKTFSYLDNSYIYKTMDIAILQKIDSSIVDKATYDAYINKIALNYKTANNFLNNLNKCINSNANDDSKLLNYHLSANTLNYADIYKTYNYSYTSNVYYPQMFSALILFFNIVASILFFINFKKKE